MRLFRRQTHRPPEGDLWTWRALSEGVLFSPPGGPFEGFSAALRRGSPECRAQVQLLKELADNGQAEMRDAGVLLPHEEVCRLDRETQEALGLPPPYPFDIALRAQGTFRESDFRYEVAFLTPDGKPLHPERRGCVLHLAGDWQYLLTQEQFALLEAVEAFNRRQEGRDLHHNLLAFAQIKGLARTTGALLDRYLRQEEVLTPRTIRLRLREEDGQIAILPEIPGADADQFERVFDHYPTAQNLYNLQDATGKRTRIVLRPEQQRALADIKCVRRVSREQLARMGENPTAYFDPDVIELDPTEDAPSFSERVQAIGVYRPRTYPFVSPYKSQWIPGVLWEDASGERRKLRVRDLEELRQLERRLAQAKADGQTEISWQGETYDRRELERHLPFLRRQLEHPSEPAQEAEADGPPVLLIKENIEELEYDAKPAAATAQAEVSFRHLLEPPPHLKPGKRLLPHQEEGVAWLQELWRRGYPGGLLADDMGLGKTLQILAFLEWHRTTQQREHPRPYLVVAPIALLENWAAEYPRFFEPRSLTWITLYGPMLRQFKLPLEAADRFPLPDVVGDLQERRGGRGVLDVARLQRADGILTTYETVRDFQLEMGLIAWSVVVLDEAQRVKTPGTLVTNALKALKADFRIACTGTPVENSLVDLWCIMDFVAPGHLGSARRFAAEFQHPLKQGDADPFELGTKLRGRVGLLLKRRLKESILEGLPEKHIHVEDCQRPMPPEQEERYLAALEMGRTGDAEQERGRMLRVIHRIRDACDHPLLADSRWEALPVRDLVRCSAKLRATVEILESIREAEEKVILFADRRKAQHLLQYVLREWFGLDEVFIVNGDTPGSAQRESRMKHSRQQAVDRFQEVPGFNAIILSPLAAGMGLNITGANHVIHYNRWWNPAKEDQASDRVYRIGQTRPVHIYLPMSVHPDFATFDLILHQLLERKRALSQGALFPTERAEVSPQELIDALRRPPGRSAEARPLDWEEVERLDTLALVGLVAALFEKEGYTVMFPTSGGNRGVDLILLPRPGEDAGWLVRLAPGRGDRRQGSHFVREIVAVRAAHERQLARRFQLTVVTSGTFTQEAERLARTQGVTLHDRDWLRRQLKRFPLTLADVNQWALGKDH